MNAKDNFQKPAIFFEELTFENLAGGLETSGGMRVIGRFLCTISTRRALAELQKIQEGLCNSNPSQDILSINFD